jgi:hypothetical protein
MVITIRHAKKDSKMASWGINGELQLPRACDRCHANKERCEWNEDADRCARCLRLKHTCETVRPKGRPGRKPGGKSKGKAGIRFKKVCPELQSRRSVGFQDGRRVCAWNRWRVRAVEPPETVPRCILEFSDVPSADQQMLQRLLFQSRLLDVFSVGSSFSEKIRQQLIPQMVLARTTLQDGLLACAVSWAGDDDVQDDPSRLSSCYRYASSALATLAALQVTNAQSMLDCLTLGALVATFALRLRLNDVLTICGRTLSLIKPIYTDYGLARQELRVFMSCMVMWELRGCLFSCAVPTLRFRPPAEAYVDRHIGLCANLLPIIYDICRLSHALATSKDNEAAVFSELDVIEQSLRQWQPEIPERFTSHFSSIEVAHMLCQVQSMRPAILLVTHRLRYPFGVNDMPAQVLSMTILTQLEMTFAATGEHVRCIDLALLVACLELKEPERQKWMPRMARFAGFSPQYGDHVLTTVLSLWSVMDQSETISWRELTKRGSPFLRHSMDC